MGLSTCGYLLGQRPQDEFSLGDAHMWDREPFVVNLFVAVEQDVEVDVAGALVDEFSPAHVPLNRLELVQQSQGLELGFDLQSPSAL